MGSLNGISFFFKTHANYLETSCRINRRGCILLRCIQCHIVLVSKQSHFYRLSNGFVVFHLSTQCLIKVEGTNLREDLQSEKILLSERRHRKLWFRVVSQPANAINLFSVLELLHYIRAWILPGLLKPAPAVARSVYTLPNLRNWKFTTRRRKKCKFDIPLKSQIAATEEDRAPFCKLASFLPGLHRCR